MLTGLPPFGLGMASPKNPDDSRDALFGRISDGIERVTFPEGVFGAASAAEAVERGYSAATSSGETATEDEDDVDVDDGIGSTAGDGHFAAHLIQKLLINDPDERLGSNSGNHHASGAVQLKAHPWFAQAPPWYTIATGGKGTAPTIWDALDSTAVKLGNGMPPINTEFVETWGNDDDDDEGGTIDADLDAQMFGGF